MPKPTSPLRGLATLPQTYDGHEWADYIELLCLATKDGRISKADVLDFVRERKNDLKEGKPIEDPEAEDAEIEEEMEIADEEKDDEDIDEETTEPAIANDKWDLRADDWFQHLEYRAGAFAEFYPFLVAKGGTVLALKSSKAVLSLKRKVYIFLLLASNLRYASNSDRTSIASIFELASFYALEAYLSPQSKVFMFGKHSLNTGPYTGKLWAKLNKMATEIRESVICNEADFKPNDTGDAGLDLIAWTLLEDQPIRRRGFLIAFGQCACTPKWVSKQYEINNDTWKSFMTFTVDPLRFTFIPYCFRNPTGAWYRYKDIHNTVLIDRLRAIDLLRGRQTVLRPHILIFVDSVLSRAVSVL